VVIGKMSTEHDEDILHCLLVVLHNLLMSTEGSIHLSITLGVVPTLCELLRRSEFTVSSSSPFSTSVVSIRALSSRCLLGLSLSREGQVAMVSSDGGRAVFRLVALLEKDGVSNAARSHAAGTIANLCAEFSTEGRKLALEAGALLPLFEIVKSYAQWQKEHDTKKILTIDEQEMEGTVAYSLQALGVLSEHPQA